METETAKKVSRAGRPRYTDEEKAAAASRKIALREAKKAAVKLAKIQVDASFAGQPVVAEQTLEKLFEEMTAMRSEITELRALISQTQQQPN